MGPLGRFTYKTGVGGFRTGGLASFSHHKAGEALILWPMKVAYHQSVLRNHVHLSIGKS